jgi:hypothetical protein
MKELLVQAEEIVDNAFGDDYEKDIHYLLNLRDHTIGCGCRSCMSVYVNEVVRIAKQYTVPNNSWERRSDELACYDDVYGAFYDIDNTL